MQNKTIIVYGADSDMGKAICDKFTRKEWNVIGVGNKPTDIDFNMYYQCDISSGEQLMDLKNSMDDESVSFDAMAIITNNHKNIGFENVNSDEWNNILSASLYGTANCIRMFAPHLVEKGSGKILIITPDYKDAEGDNILNAAAGGTLHGFSKSLGVELAEKNVLVNTLWPAYPLDNEAIADMTHYLSEADTYTTAQVISLNGKSEI